MTASSNRQSRGQKPLRNRQPANQFILVFYRIEAVTRLVLLAANRADSGNSKTDSRGTAPGGVAVGGLGFQRLVIHRQEVADT